MGQTLVTIASPYEVQWVAASGPLAANTAVVGPVTRSCKVASVQFIFNSQATQSGSVQLIHDPGTGPLGTGSVIGSALLITQSQAGAITWAVTGSLQMVSGDMLTLQVTGSSVGLGAARLAVQIVPN